ncbi:hypothetical protein M1770_09215 [Spiroplasma citri]|uniref:Uncharacterized protein n=1 Tax=Spiroplasma citri TaxID=2133 RepID=Q14Q41_SPICI|nr:hypothetical protein [Spiroplasma citri]WFG98204.1 hypothetical protein M1770_09215 [Spiroplasma citri]CAK98388.1 hypothetical protein SPICI01B_141 [Spiroplasma citri]
MEKIKIRNYEITLEEYQIDTLLDILKEFMKANLIKSSEELVKGCQKLKIMAPKTYNELFLIKENK